MEKSRIEGILGNHFSLSVSWLFPNSVCFHAEMAPTTIPPAALLTTVVKLRWGESITSPATKLRFEDGKTLNKFSFHGRVTQRPTISSSDAHPHCEFCFQKFQSTCGREEKIVKNDLCPNHPAGCCTKPRGHFVHVPFFCILPGLLHAYLAASALAGSSRRRKRALPPNPDNLKATVS